MFGVILLLEVFYLLFIVKILISAVVHPFVLFYFIVFGLRKMKPGKHCSVSVAFVGLTGCG